VSTADAVDAAAHCAEAPHDYDHKMVAGQLVRVRPLDGWRRGEAGMVNTVRCWRCGTTRVDSYDHRFERISREYSYPKVVQAGRG
jgi:hypothetical protein